MDDPITFSCLEVKQPIGTFYIGVIDSDNLAAISFADIRRPDGREIERYIGTQRDLAENRVKEIKKYVTTVDACFPTGIILAVKPDDALYDEDKKTLSIKNDSNVAKIIDGQHRIAGLEDYSGKQFQLNVTVFLDMDIEDQAMVFATINLKQTKVTKSLGYDLFEYAKSRSPQKTCHNVAKLMNSKKTSPFYHRIKILGKATGKGTEVITQSTFVDRLMVCLSNDAMSDRDLIKRGRELPMAREYRTSRLVFRDLFINDKDAVIAKTVWNYYSAIKRRWPAGWDNFGKGMILCKSTGFAAFMRLLPYIINYLDLTGKVISEDDFYEVLEESSLADDDFTSDNFKPGSSGEGELFRNLRDEVL